MATLLTIEIASWAIGDGGLLSLMTWEAAQSGYSAKTHSALRNKPWRHLIQDEQYNRTDKICKANLTHCVFIHAKLDSYRGNHEVPK